MFVAIHPAQASDVLSSAISGAGFETIAVDDAAAVFEQEPETGWAALVVELGDSHAGPLSLARRVRDGGGPPVLVLVGDDYYVKFKKTGKLGRMLELYPNAQ